MKILQDCLRLVDVGNDTIVEIVTNSSLFSRDSFTEEFVTGRPYLNISKFANWSIFANLNLVTS